MSEELPKDSTLIQFTEDQLDELDDKRSPEWILHELYCLLKSFQTLDCDCEDCECIKKASNMLVEWEAGNVRA